MVSARRDAAAIPGARRAMWSWFLFDWANSPFPTVIITFVFSAYFTKAVAPDPISGTAWWGYAISLSALAVAIAGPVLGAIADHTGRRKPWLLASSLLAVTACGMLWFAAPGTEAVWWILILVAVANFGFELGTVFYNAMLPELAPAARIGRWSGWAWGLGFAGGLVCLVVSLFGFIQTDRPLFGIAKEDAANVRAVAVFVAVWWVVFGWPLFAFTPEAVRRLPVSHRPIAGGLRSLAGTLRHIGKGGPVLRFLVARMIYTDGLTTLFAFGGIYAAGTFGMELNQVILFGIGLNVTAGLGAAAFATIDDRIGSRRTIVVSLLCLLVLGALVLLADDVMWFWVFGLMLGIFIGPVQSASRTLMARLAPADSRTEMFGLFALSGKATAFIGPALLGWVTALADSQRAGMATILAFFVVGLVILWPLREPGSDAAIHPNDGSGGRP